MSGSHGRRWSVRTVGRISCDHCKSEIFAARVEVRDEDYRFVCPDHPLPIDITHPIFVATK